MGGRLDARKLCGAPQACEGGKGTDRPENALRKTFRRQETHDRRRRAGHPAQDRRQGLLRDSVGLDGAGYAAGNDPRIDDVRARMRRRAPAAGADARRVQSGGQHRGSGAAERRLAAEGRFGARRDGRRRGRLRQHRGAIPDQGLQRRPDGRGDRRHGALLHGHSGTLPDRRRIRSVRYFGRDEDRPDPRDRCPELERRTLRLHFDAVQRERMAVHLSGGCQSARGCGCRLLARSHARGKHAAPAGRRPHRPVHDRKEGALRGGRACRRGEVRRTLEHRSGVRRPTCAASSRTRCARSRCTWTRICPRRGASR